MLFRSVKIVVEMVPELVKEVRGISVSVKHIPPPYKLSPIESRNLFADSREFKRATGWKPQYSIKRGIVLTLKKYSSTVKK